MTKKKYFDEVSEAINHRIYAGSNKKFTPRLILEMEREWDYMSAKEYDYRSGEEYNDYSDPVEVALTLEHISDRHRCALRTRWLLDGLYLGKI